MALFRRPFAGPGGRIVFSGRSREFVDRIEHGLRRSRASLHRNVYFIDEEGVCAMYQRGVWLFQKFHTAARVRESGDAFVGVDAKVRTETSDWAVAGTKAIDAPDAEGSIRREFNLPLPGGLSIDRAYHLIAAWQIAIGKTEAVAFV